MSITVVKRDGRLVPFDETKITLAISKALKCSPQNLVVLINEITSQITQPKISVEEIQDLVEKALINHNYADAAKAYILYRNERTKRREARSDLNKTISSLVSSEASDLDLKRENANIDGNAPMGIMLQFGSEVSKKFALENLIEPEQARAHQEGLIHIHDLNLYSVCWNCCQLPAGKLLKQGFSTGHGYIREPNSIQTAAALMCIIIQSNQNSMFGGQAIPLFEYDLAPYVMKSYFKNLKELAQYEGISLDISSLETYSQDNNTIIDYNPFSSPIEQKIYQEARKLTEKQTYQAMEALIHNLNTMQSRCIEENQEVLTLDVSSVRNLNKMSDIEKEALKELLLDLYQTHTLIEIAEELHTSKKVLTNIFKKLGIKTRNPKEKAKFNQTIFLDRFGVTNPMKLQSIKEKVKEAQFKENKGKYAFNTEKQKQTMLLKYGVDNIMKNPEFRQKFKEQLKDKYGVTCTLQLDSVRTKAEQTCLERYGARNVLCKESSIYPDYNFKSHPELQEKALLNLQSKYGSSGLGVSSIRAKIENTCLDRYNHVNPALPLMHGKSKSEETVVNAIKEVFPEIELHLNKRSLFSVNLRLEVDIFIPQVSLGIEVNGSYSHNKDLYLQDLADKTCFSKERFKEIEAINNGFTLIHVWEDSLEEDVSKVLVVIEERLHD